MNTLKLQFTQLNIPQKHPSNHTQTHQFPSILHLGSSSFSTTTKSRTIICGLRKIGPKKPLWRSSFLSTEAIQAVHSLKLAKSPDKLQHVIHTRLTRLLKADLLDTLTELQRQNHLDLALQVFDFVKKEYKPDLPLYYDMILLLGKNKLIHKAEELFDELKKEGLQPDVRAYTELIGAYFQVDMVEKAVETYNEMKVSGCIPDKLTLMIMVRNLEKAGKEELAASVKSDFEEYVDEPEKFLEEVEKKYGRDLSIV
ncbi:pentatricopeptide repeat-containing protein At3g46870-like [Chenopodium quinoa]|uniref:pentatricopeptide repeat-containing protein At3g46870-like n=1 Tax=Chenopodium quinoa TaxID=63459 RepID=UPI000B7729AC|nr:pentatricopeptide repeat-containing protein At3g46870-like [Chenopodium quinoa]